MHLFYLTRGTALADGLDAAWDALYAQNGLALTFNPWPQTS